MSYIKLFFNSSTIHFTDEQTNLDNKNSGFLLNYKDTTSQELKRFLLNNKNSNIIIYSKNFNDDFDKFTSHFTLINAAGGIVTNREKELLVIYRLNKYDLPKGKCEAGETIQETAIREVEEECGVKNLSITSESKQTYHFYILNNQLVLKCTYWFNMKTDKQLLTPQTEEDITWAKWIPIAQKNEIIEKTYPSIAELLNAVDLNY